MRQMIEKRQAARSLCQEIISLYEKDADADVTRLCAEARKLLEKLKAD